MSSSPAQAGFLSGHTVGFHPPMPHRSMPRFVPAMSCGRPQGTMFLKMPQNTSIQDKKMLKKVKTFCILRKILDLNISPVMVNGNCVIIPPTSEGVRI